MINNFVKASIYMFSMSFSCVLSDILSKKINMDTYSLLFLRFLFSAMFLIIYYCCTKKDSKRSLFFTFLIALTLSIQLILITLASSPILKLLSLITLFSLLINLFINTESIDNKITLIPSTLIVLSYIKACHKHWFTFANLINLTFANAVLVTEPKYKKNFKHFLTFNNLIRGALFSFGMLFFIYGLKNLSLGLVILLNFCTPILTVLLSKIFLKEKLRHRLITCIINTLGIFIALCTCTKNIKLSAVFSVIAASTCFALIDTFNKFNLKKNEGILNILIGTSFISAIFFAILICLRNKSLYILSSYDFVLSILIGILAILIPLFAIKASQFSDLSALQPLKYIEFPLSIIASYLFFSDNYTYHIFIGFLIIIIGSLFSYVKEVNSSKH